MAKKAKMPGERAARKSIRQFEKASAKDLRKDVKETGRTIDAAFGNVATTHKGTKKRLNSYNRGRIEQVMKLKDNMAKAGRRDVRRVKSREDNFGTMGGMLSGVYSRSEKNAEQGAKTGNVIAGAGEKLTRNLDETSRTALQMMKYGAQEAESGAEYALAEAQSVRAKADAETAAQMRFQLAQAKMEHQLRIAEMEKQAEIDRKNLQLQQKAAEGALGGSFPGIKSAASQLATIGNDIFKMVQNDATADEIWTAIQQKYQLTESQDLGYVQRLIQLLSTDLKGVSGRNEMIADITSVIESVPGWGKLGGKRKNIVRDLVASFVNYDGIVRDLEDEKKKDEEEGDPFPGNITDDVGLSGWIGDTISGFSDEEGLSALWSKKR